MQNWPYPRIVTHRGGGSLAPENTLASMKKGVALGFRGVEFDVKLANYATPILMHDETLDRTTNGSGAVKNFTYADLAKLDAGSWFSAAYAGEPIPLFETVAKFLIEHDTWANVEIKPCKGREDITGETVALATREHWRGVALKPVLSSFSIAALHAAKSAAPELPRCYLVDEVPPDWKITMQQLECIALHCKWTELSRELASEIRSAGYSLLVFTVNDAAAARKLFKWGVDALVTDRLDRITPAFA